MRLVGVFGLAVLAFSASVFALPTIHTNRDLLEDIFEFIQLVPLDEIEEVIKKWIKKDASVEATFEFLESDRYLELIDLESRNPEFLNYLNFLEDSRAPAYDLWNLYRLVIGLDPIRQKVSSSRAQIDPAPTLLMVDECLALLDKKKFEDLYNKKMEESEDFKFFFDRMETDEHKAVKEALENNAEYKKIVDEFLYNGYDMYKIANKIYVHFFPKK